MKLIDRHNKIVGPRQKTETITLISFAGGINLADNPLSLSEKELLAAENWQYAPTGAAIETRDAISSGIDTNGTDPSSMSAIHIVGGVEEWLAMVANGRLYSAPPIFMREYPLDLLRCSDFTVDKYGLWGVPDIVHRCSDFQEAVSP